MRTTGSFLGVWVGGWVGGKGGLPEYFGGPGMAAGQFTVATARRKCSRLIWAAEMSSRIASRPASLHTAASSACGGGDGSGLG